MTLRERYQTWANEGDVGGVVGRRAEKAARLLDKRLTGRSRFLDVGCGVGAITLLLKERLKFDDAYGVDIAEANVEEAQRRGVLAQQVDLNTSNLPFPEQFFDAIFAGEIIEHMVDPDHLLQESHRALKPDGILVLTTPNLASWYNRAALLLGWQPVDTGTSFYYTVGRPRLFKFGEGATAGHLRLYTLRALGELLQAHDFRILDIAAVPARESGKFVQDRWFLAPVFLLDRFMTLRPSLGARLVVAAKPTNHAAQSR